jgi:hypothetical protein
MHQPVRRHEQALAGGCFDRCSAVPCITSVGTAIEDNSARHVALRQRCMVLIGRDVAGTLDIATDELKRAFITVV